MRFPRNARIFRGQLDAAPFASVFFLIIIFVLLASLVSLPGIRVDLPSSGDLVLPEADRPAISIAVTTNAIFFQNQLLSEDDFSNRLHAVAKTTSEPPTLVVQADKDVTEERLIHLWVLANHAAGIEHMHLATLPRVFDAPGSASTPP